ncbi:hypothetical protein OIU85_026518 [Salix viminalis]|uniref:Uncharacterized protein n=1 Tax=Salix viminalis TaxID=40686 RepID=A0A9Q0YYQ9_SALVM|nr:hypothetical protein OIU85_026518 [Salix viminalis]
MNKAPMYHHYEASDYGAYEFDPEVDFTKFLEEARQHAREMNLQSPLPHPESGKGRVEEEKRSRGSWKRTLLKWWKAGKKRPGLVWNRQIALTFQIQKRVMFLVQFMGVAEESMQGIGDRHLGH